jgi:hypothetical protein
MLEEEKKLYQFLRLDKYKVFHRENVNMFQAFLLIKLDILWNHSPIVKQFLVDHDYSNIN